MHTLSAGDTRVSHGIKDRLLNMLFITKQGQQQLFGNVKPFLQQKRQCEIRTDGLDLTTVQSIKKEKKIHAFISNEAWQLFLDTVEIMKPNNTSPGTFSCLKFGRVTSLERIARLSISIRALYIYSVIKMICSYKRDNMIMSTLYCNFLWAVRKQRQSDSLWEKISLEDIHCLTEKSLYSIPVKAPSQLTEELYGHLSTKTLSSSQLIWEF